MAWIGAADVTDTGLERADPIPTVSVCTIREIQQVLVQVQHMAPLTDW